MLIDTQKKGSNKNKVIKAVYFSLSQTKLQKMIKINFFSLIVKFIQKKNLFKLGKKKKKMFFNCKLFHLG